MEKIFQEIKRKRNLQDLYTKFFEAEYYNLSEVERGKLLFEITRIEKEVRRLQNERNEHYANL